MRKWLAAAAAAAMLLSVGLFAAGASADTTPGSSLEGGVEFTSGTIVAKGAGVDVAFDLVCRSASGGPFWVTEYGVLSISQRAGSTIARGYGSVGYGLAVTCDGTAVNHLVIRVRSDTAPFKAATALADIEICLSNLGSYQNYGCVTDSGSLRLRK